VPRPKPIVKLQALAVGQTVKFQFERDGITREGFLANFAGRLLAYENRCRHLPLSLDRDDNRFFAANGEHFVCQNHGAMFEPATGLCVRGPCEGVSLFPLKIETRGGMVWLADEEGWQPG
jgi:nitrite reductase/ring-hydroxylating ferredoxin subunit